MPNSPVFTIIVLPQSGIPEAYVQATHHVIRNILNLVPGQKRYNMAVANNAKALADAWALMSEKRTIQNSRRFHYHQIKATLISQQLKKLALSNPPVDGIFLSTNSIYDKDLNYVLGFSNNAYSVIANGFNTPFQLAPSEFLQVLKHELGHKFGATEKTNRPESELVHHEKFGDHCKTPGCVMNIVNSVNDIRSNPNANFCPGCVTAMRRELSR